MLGDPSIKKNRRDNMHTFFYSNISEFFGNLLRMLDEGTYKRTIYNKHKLVRKAQLFKSADISMLVHGCGASHYSQFMIELKIYIKFYQNHTWEVI